MRNAEGSDTTGDAPGFVAGYIINKRKFNSNNNG